MNDGIAHSAAALDLMSKIQDARAQNLANASTDGYRKRVASAEAFASALRSAGGLELPEYRQHIDFNQGNLRLTGRELDVGIEGRGFFSLETDAGVRFTRNGSFNTNEDGFVVAPDGARVLGEAGPLQIDPGFGSVVIDEKGQITQGEETVGRLRIVEFNNEGRLIPEGASRFREGPDAEPRDAKDIRVRQGELEQSNVNVVDELVQMITGFRAFEAAQKSLIAVDRIRAEGIGARQ